MGYKYLYENYAEKDVYVTIEHLRVTTPNSNVYQIWEELDEFRQMCIKKKPFDLLDFYNRLIFLIK